MKNINIDGKEYELNLEEALKTGVLKKRLAIGDKFRHKGGEIYILSEIRNGTGPRYATLISSQSGEQYSHDLIDLTVIIGNHLPDSVFNDLAHPFANNFTPIS